MTELFGVVHLPSLRAHSRHRLGQIVEFAVSQAVLLDELNFDGVIIENFGDTPFAKNRVDDTIVTKLAVICHEVRQEIGGRIGLNILRNATVQAMKVASVLNLDFVRSNVWEGAYVTDQGIIEGVAHEVIATRDRLHSSVEIYADIGVKHATPLSDFSLVEMAQQAIERGGADRVIISGRATGSQIDLAILDELNEQGIKPMIGSGLTQETLSSYVGKISAGIVGTALKENEVTSPISIQNARQFQEKWAEQFVR